MTRREFVYGEPLVWGNQEQAARDGWCCICEQPISPGDILNLVRTGPRQGDWQKAHIQCAWDYPQTRGRPEIPPSGVVVKLKPATPSKSKQERIDAWPAFDSRFLRKSTQPKWAVWVGIRDDYVSSVIVHRDSVEDCAIGVAKYIAGLPGDLQYALMDHALANVSQDWPRKTA